MIIGFPHAQLPGLAAFEPHLHSGPQLQILLYDVMGLPVIDYTKTRQPATGGETIETLINHFVSVSWGPVMPAGEACQMIEATKGINSYYLTSDAGTMSYRTRIRTPSFPHLQQIPSVIRGSLIADLIAYLASIDFVMADVDR